MSSDAAQYVKNASKADVIDKVAEADNLKGRLVRMQRTAKQQAITLAGMGAEALGAMAGGGLVGWMEAKDLEEWVALAGVAAGTVGAIKLMEDPENPYYRALFSTSLAIGSSVIAGYSRDYFGGGNPQPMT